MGVVELNPRSKKDFSQYDNTISNHKISILKNHVISLYVNFYKSCLA